MTKVWSWRWAIVGSNLKPPTRHVLLTMMCWMNDDGGECWPSTKTLANATGMSERAVCQHIALAKQEGWVEVTHRRAKGRAWRLNQYQARVPAGADLGSVPQGDGADPKSVTQSDEVLTLTQRGADRGSVYLSKELIKEKEGSGGSGGFHQRRISPVDHQHPSASDRADGQRGLWNGAKASAVSVESKKTADDRVSVSDDGIGGLFAQCERLMGKRMPRKNGAWYFPADIVAEAKEELAACARRGVV